MDQRGERLDDSFDEETSSQPAPELRLAIADRLTHAGVTAAGNLLIRVCGTRYGKVLNYDSGGLTDHEVAILRFLGSLELIESDVWQQYDELAGLKPGSKDTYRLALQSLNKGISDFVTSCALDEISHSTYFSAYLTSEGGDPVDLDRYRILRGSGATGAQDVGRLTNLQHLNLDLRWKAQHLDATARKDQYLFIDSPSIPSSDIDLEEPSRGRMIARTAAFHFVHIEDLIARLYASLCLKIRRVKILRVIFGIGSNELAHFYASVDLARKAVPALQFFIEDAMDRIDNRLNASDRHPLWERSFPWMAFPFFAESPDLNDETTARPTGSTCNLAVRTIDHLAQSGLFTGQSREFTGALFQLAHAADSAVDAEADRS